MKAENFSLLKNKIYMVGFRRYQKKSSKCYVNLLFFYQVKPSREKLVENIFLNNFFVFDIEHCSEYGYDNPELSSCIYRV